MYSKTKKSIFLSFAFIIFFLSVNAQALLQFSAQEKPSFKQMQRDFAAWKDTTNLKESKNWKYIKRWEADMQMHTDAQGEPTGGRGQPQVALCPRHGVEAAMTHTRRHTF